MAPFADVVMFQLNTKIRKNKNAQKRILRDYSRTSIINVTKCDFKAEMHSDFKSQTTNLRGKTKWRKEPAEMDVTMKKKTTASG